MNDLLIQMPSDIENLQLPDNNLLQYYLDEKERILWLDQGIDESVFSIIKKILQWNREDKGIPKEKRKPIKIFIDSIGGCPFCGFSLIDAICLSETDVWTINVGKCYSAAFYIMIAGHKRIAFPNSTFLIHDGEVEISSTGNKSKDVQKFLDQLEMKTTEFSLSHTKISEIEFESKADREWYIYADEAKEKGIIDYIIGEDGFGLDKIL